MERVETLRGDLGGENHSVSAIDKIKELDSLRDEGIICADDFEKKKTELLNLV